MLGVDISVIPEGLTVLQQCVHSLIGIDQRLQFRVGSGFFLHARQAIGQGLQVGQHQLGIDDVDVLLRVVGVIYVRDIGIVESSDDLDNGIGAAN